MNKLLTSSDFVYGTGLSRAICNSFVGHYFLRANGSAISAGAGFNNLFDMFKSHLVVGFATSFGFVRKSVLSAVGAVLPDCLFLKSFNSAVYCADVFDKGNYTFETIKHFFQKFNHGESFHGNFNKQQ